MRRLYLSLATLLLAATAFAQRDFSAVEVNATKVNGTVYMLTGAGGNIGVSIGEDGIVIVDDQYAPLAPKIEAALKKITDKPVRFVLNTHYHGDHTGGNEHFGKSAPIVAHENVRSRLKTGVPSVDVPPSPRGALPVVTFQDSVTIHLNDEDIRAVHFANAHTDGDAVIWFTQSNVVHMGDNFFNGTFPFIDVGSGGSTKGIIDTARKVASMVPDDTKIIPGHGPLGDRTSLRAFADMLEGTSAAVKRGIDAGKTLDQLKQENILAQWESWGKGFFTPAEFMEMLYNELVKK